MTGEGRIPQRIPNIKIFSFFLSELGDNPYIFIFLKLKHLEIEFFNTTFFDKFYIAYRYKITLLASRLKKKRNHREIFQLEALEYNILN